LKFVFDLASHLGKTVAEMLGQMSSQELTYWMAYMSLKAKEREKADREREMAQRSRAATSSVRRPRR
jgi:hypothetical protein